MVKCRECGSLSDFRAPSCPDCGALRPGVRFDADATDWQRAFIAIRNGLLFHVLTPRNLLVAAVLVVLGLVVYRTTRPTPEESAARAKEAAAAAVVSRDSGVISSMKRDLREAMTAEEMYFAGINRYGTLDQLKKEGFTLSVGNTMVLLPSTSGYTVTVTNATLSSGPAECTVRIGGRDVPDSLNGVIACHDPKASRPTP